MGEVLEEHKENLGDLNLGFTSKLFLQHSKLLGTFAMVVIFTMKDHLQGVTFQDGYESIIQGLGCRDIVEFVIAVDVFQSINFPRQSTWVW